ncbi:MAG: inositol-3-phosphate synthase [Candidatus Methanomethylicota archaeon]|uniref:Inositol-3-phosphate synthase n=1 Tax=Thermoproteota archaeon TaxID=2056631 RepID=A0A520KDZ6_9CREN|nr:MAG: inositol-3-phosphate synthase [Candidatus Verstraetearchaeota archaeon]TDA38855.1 MAG: inositol-3-phosphate synthase [Candidatus Verstraetearchaeota archaeon]
MSIKVAIVGVGNCCCSLVQAINFYKNSDIGIMHMDIGGYKPYDIEIVGAIDIDKRKVGKDLSEAIFSKPNVTKKFIDVPYMNVKVVKGEVLDGTSGILKDLIIVSNEPSVDIEDYLKSINAEILVNLLPTGAKKASEFYAEKAIKAKCAFINCTTTKIASDINWNNKFKENGLPLIGDDLMSQIGGTVFHLGLIEFLNSRGVKIEKTYQLDIGGSMEAYGILEEERKEEKRNIKTQIIENLLPKDSKITTGTSDFVEFMKDRRTSYFYIEGRNCLGSDVIIDIYLRTNDGPNGAGILLDIIRATKLALERKLSGSILSICAYGFKNPPVKYSVSQSRKLFEDFIGGKTSM